MPSILCKLGIHKPSRYRSHVVIIHNFKRKHGGGWRKINSIRKYAICVRCGKVLYNRRVM